MRGAHLGPEFSDAEIENFLRTQSAPYERLERSDLLERVSEILASEKMRLFRDIPAEGWLLVPADEPLLAPVLRELRCRVYRFGEASGELPFIEHRAILGIHTEVAIRFPSDQVVQLRLQTPSQQIVADIDSEGRDSAAARELLTALRHLQDQYIAHRYRIIKWLE